MNSYSFGALVGSLVPAFLLSRLCLWIVGKWMTGVPANAVAHAIVLVLSSLLSAHGHADGGAPDYVAAVISTAPATAFWFLFEFIRARRRAAATEPSGNTNK